MNAMHDAPVEAMPPRRSRWYGWYVTVLLVGAAAASAIAYARLPARVALHWNVAGQPDKFGPPLVLALTLPLVMAGIVLLARILPAIDPLRANYDKFLPTYRFVFALVLTLLLGFHLMALALALGEPVPIARLSPASIALLFILLGNVLPRARRNWMFGIRTPWTLSSDRVWARTHRVGGYVMTTAGIVMLISLFVVRGTSSIVIVPAIAIAAGAVCVIYSYAAWRQESHQ